LQDYISALMKKYPNATVQTDEDFEVLTFNYK
jgi:hypothetical protein